MGKRKIVMNRRPKVKLFHRSDDSGKCLIVCLLIVLAVIGIIVGMCLSDTFAKIVGWVFLIVFLYSASHNS